jgi:2-amino-4-hydroxy-6-hydroxymethyldihydropteridine diphosphokinase
MTPTTVLLGLGANVGDALETLTAAVFALDDLDGLAVVDVSAVYRTPPWPPPGEPGAVDQPPFLNLVVRAVSTLPARALLAETQLVEAAFGRDRDTEVRGGPRPLDIDLLTYGDEVIDEPGLTIPHPRIAERACKPSSCINRTIRLRVPLTTETTSGSCRRSRCTPESRRCVNVRRLAQCYRSACTAEALVHCYANGSSIRAAILGAPHGVKSLA